MSKVGRSLRIRMSGARCLLVWPAGNAPPCKTHQSLILEKYNFPPYFTTRRDHWWVAEKIEQYIGATSGGWWSSSLTSSTIQLVLVAILSANAMSGTLSDILLVVVLITSYIYGLDVALAGQCREVSHQAGSCRHFEPASYPLLVWSSQVEVQVIRSDGRCVAVVKDAFVNIISVQKYPRRSWGKVEKKWGELRRNSDV